MKSKLFATQIQMVLNANKKLAPNVMGDDEYMNDVWNGIRLSSYSILQGPDEQAMKLAAHKG